MTTPLKTIDYDAIFQELLNGRRTLAEVRQDNPIGLEQYLNEYSTFWIGTSRQRGKTQWALECLQHDPASAMVTVNSPFRNINQQRMDDRGLVRPLLTAKDVQAELFNGDAPQRNLRLVIVDDAFYTLDRLKRSHLNKWVVKNGSPDTVIVMLTT